MSESLVVFLVLLVVVVNLNVDTQCKIYGFETSGRSHYWQPFRGYCKNPGWVPVKDAELMWIARRAVTR